MADDKTHQWVDTVSKLLLPVVIFAGGLFFSMQKDKNDRANQQFERESNILKLVASSNEKERALGLKIIEIEQKEGKFSQDLLPVVQVISQGVPSDDATQAAQSILATAVKQDAAIKKEVAPVDAHSGSPNAYIQIAKEEQRAEAKDFQSLLQANRFTVQGIELVSQPTSNNYIRYFFAEDKPLADQVVGFMKDKGFPADAQRFPSTNVAHGTIEIWFGKNQDSGKK